MEFEGKKYEYPPHEISIGHAKEEKKIKGREGGALLPKFLKERLKLRLEF